MALIRAGAVTYLSRNGGGMMESSRHLHQALAKLPDTQVTVFGKTDECVDESLPAWAPLEVKTFPVSGPRQFLYASGLQAALLKSDRDIFHTDGLWTYSSMATAAWHRKVGRPYVISIHGMLDPWAVQNSGWKKKVALALYERNHLSQAACLRALCEAEAQAIREFGLTNPICIIPNGVTLPTGPIQPSESLSRALGKGRRVLLYLGRLHPKKGLVHLLEAWRTVREQKPREGEAWMLALAGWDQGGHEEQLRKLVREGRLEDSVCFLGPQFGANQVACYAACDAFILPSLSEGLPMVVLEAWSQAKPVLMTPQCHLPEGFAARAALRVEPEPASLAEGLRQLFALTSEERRLMGARGCAWVQDKFAWPKIALEMRDVYAWLLGQAPQPACVRRN